MDQKSYRKTFEQVRMSPRRAEQIRLELAARCAEHEMEDNMDNNRKNRRPVAALLAVCVVAVLSVTAFASGGVGRVIRMMTTSDIDLTIPDGVENLPDGVHLTVDGTAELPEDTVSPVELREDGQVYLTINGENQDITGQFSYETPYVYDCVGEDGLTHYFIIGGEPEDIGWVEYACDSSGEVAVSGVAMSVPEDVELTTLPWLNKGLEQAMGGLVEIQAEEDGGNFQIFHFLDATEDGDAEVCREETVTITEYEG